MVVMPVGNQCYKYKKRVVILSGLFVTALWSMEFLDWKRTSGISASIRANFSSATTSSSRSTSTISSVSSVTNAPTTTKKQRKEPQQESCNFLLEKYSGDAFWSHFQLQQESFPTAREDPIIILPNTTGGNSTVKPFAFCTIPKNGCSRWRRFFRRVQGVANYLSNPHHADNNGLKYPSDFDESLWQRTQKENQWWLSSSSSSSSSSPNYNYNYNSTAPTNLALFRLAIVRDPLARALSAWKDKIQPQLYAVSNGKDHNCPPNLDPVNNFTHFIQCLYHQYQQQPKQQPTQQQLSSHNSLDNSNNIPCSWNPHWRPQACLCHLNQMKYDMLLPVEQKNVWYTPLVDCLQVQPWTYNFSKSGDDFGSQASSSGMGSSITGSGSLEHLCQAYQHPQIVAMAREIYQHDLIFSTWNWETDCQSNNITHAAASEASRL